MRVLAQLLIDLFVESRRAKRWRRCACGAERSDKDPRTTQVNGEEHEARLFGNHGPMFDLVCRSCRSCGAVYAHTRNHEGREVPHA